jgi:hypothetical protein
VDATRFPTAAHVVSRAKFAPITATPSPSNGAALPAGGNPWRTLLAPGPTPSKSRPIVAVGNSVLTIIWHLLADPEDRYHDLGSNFYQSRINASVGNLT